MVLSWDPSWLAIISSIAVKMLLGFFWYSPILFGNMWMKEMNLVNPNFQKQVESGASSMTYILNVLFVLLFVIAYEVLFDSLEVGAYGLGMALLWILIVWAGFLLPMFLNGVLWEGKSVKWLLIVSGFELCSLVLIGNIFYFLR